MLETVDSTNAEAVRMAHGLVRPTWIMAERQTAGRGRRGRAWIAPPGNLTATLMMRPGGHPSWAALRSFLAANALFETLALYVDRSHLALKWPNDVLLEGCKVAGILLESAGRSGRLDWLAIGFGVNLIHTPEITEEGAMTPISLTDVTGTKVKARDFLTLLASHYATEEQILERLGFAPIRSAWLARAAKLGEEITARTGTRTITGLFDTIDENGQLVLITATGPVTIAAADIYF